MSIVTSSGTGTALEAEYELRDGGLLIGHDSLLLQGAELRGRGLGRTARGDRDPALGVARQHLVEPVAQLVRPAGGRPEGTLS